MDFNVKSLNFISTFPNVLPNIDGFY